ncbi:MAG TPA: hypothetical protein VGM91_14695 [Conexibacter sp.]
MSTTEQTPRRMNNTTGLRAVTIEAPDVDQLGTEAARWLAANPFHEVVTLSYAPHVRSEPRSGMAGPRDVAVERGVMIVRPV